MVNNLGWRDFDGKAKLWLGDCLDVAGEYPEDFFTLLLTSTPYPGQRGFDLSVPEYLSWLANRLSPWMYRIDRKRGVIVLNIMFRRQEDGIWDYRIFQIPQLLSNMGLFCQDTYIWDKLNSPPSGNHKRHDRQEYEFCFVFSRSKDYTFNPQRKPYAQKTIGKVHAGNMRKSDIAGSLSGGHADLHPQGALQGNVLRISSSGDQNRPRVNGGVFPRGLADRFILTFTNPGDAVVDICAGSGTTITQAVKHGRYGVGIDIDPHTYDIACSWLNETVEIITLPLFR